MGGIPKVLILGHSFVKRLKSALSNAFDSRAKSNFDLLKSAEIYLHGIGGRTVEKLHTHDVHFVRKLKPDIVILEIGTNDLSSLAPEVVGSAIEELIVLLKTIPSVSIMCLCRVIPRARFTPHPQRFYELACKSFETIRSISRLWKVFSVGVIRFSIHQIRICIQVMEFTLMILASICCTAAIAVLFARP